MVIEYHFYLHPPKIGTNAFTKFSFLNMVNRKISAKWWQFSFQFVDSAFWLLFYFWIVGSLNVIVLQWISILWGKHYATTNIPPLISKIIWKYYKLSPYYPFPLGMDIVQQFRHFVWCDMIRVYTNCCICYLWKTCFECVFLSK